MSKTESALPPHDDAVLPVERVDAQRPPSTPTFNPKGIGPNVFFTAAAAVVPVVIIGLAAITSLTGKGRFRSGR